MVRVLVDSNLKILNSCLNLIDYTYNHTYDLNNNTYYNTYA